MIKSSVINGKCHVIERWHATAPDASRQKTGRYVTAADKILSSYRSTVYETDEGGSAEPDHMMREHKKMTHVYRFCMGVDLCCLVTTDRGTDKEGLVDGGCRSTKLFFD